MDLFNLPLEMYVNPFVRIQIKTAFEQFSKSKLSQKTWRETLYGGFELESDRSLRYEDVKRATDLFNGLLEKLAKVSFAKRGPLARDVSERLFVEANRKSQFKSFHFGDLSGLKLAPNAWFGFHIALAGLVLEIGQRRLVHTCKVCSKPFLSKKRRDAKICSHSCRDRKYRSKEEVRKSRREKQMRREKGM